jgi:hypothetical protein
MIDSSPRLCSGRGVRPIVVGSRSSPPRHGRSPLGGSRSCQPRHKRNRPVTAAAREHRDGAPASRPDDTSLAPHRQCERVWKTTLPSTKHEVGDLDRVAPRLFALDRTRGDAGGIDPMTAT